MLVERLVAAKTDLILFESEFIAAEVAKRVRPTRALTRVARNGLRPEEFTAVQAQGDAAEFVYIGELSSYKGVDTLIDALAKIHASGAHKAQSCDRRLGQGA